MRSLKRLSIFRNYSKALETIINSFASKTNVNYPKYRSAGQNFASKELLDWLTDLESKSKISLQDAEILNTLVTNSSPEELKPHEFSLLMRMIELGIEKHVFSMFNSYHRICRHIGFQHIQWIKQISNIFLTINEVKTMMFIPSGESIICDLIMMQTLTLALRSFGNLLVPRSSYVYATNCWENNMTFWTHDFFRSCNFYSQINLPKNGSMFVVMSVFKPRLFLAFSEQLFRTGFDSKFSFITKAFYINRHLPEFQPLGEMLRQMLTNLYKANALNVNFESLIQLELSGLPFSSTLYQSLERKLGHGISPDESKETSDQMSNNQFGFLVNQISFEIHKHHTIEGSPLKKHLICLLAYKIKGNEININCVATSLSSPYPSPYPQVIQDFVKALLDLDFQRAYELSDKIQDVTFFGDLSLLFKVPETIAKFLTKCLYIEQVLNLVYMFDWSKFGYRRNNDIQPQILRKLVDIDFKYIFDIFAMLFWQKNFHALNSLYKYSLFDISKRRYLQSRENKVILNRLCGLLGQAFWKFGLAKVDQIYLILENLDVFEDPSPMEATLQLMHKILFFLLEDEDSLMNFPQRLIKLAEFLLKFKQISQEDFEQLSISKDKRTIRGKRSQVEEIKAVELFTRKDFLSKHLQLWNLSTEDLDLLTATKDFHKMELFDEYANSAKVYNVIL